MSIRFIPLGVLVLLAGGALAQEVSQTPSAPAAREETRGQCGTMTGSVAAVGPDLIVIRGVESKPLPLEVGPDVEVTLGGRRTSREALTPGMEVRATYEMRDGEATAVRLEATPPAPAGPPRTQEQAPTSPPPRVEPPTSSQGAFQPSPVETLPPPPPELGPPGPLPTP